MSKMTKTNWSALVKTLAPLLALAFAGQFGLTMFESTFALFAQAKFSDTPLKVGIVFVACGGVMSVFQAGAVGFLAWKVAEIIQIGVGFALMGTGIALLATAQTKFLVFAFVALLSLGMAFIAPNLSALIAKRSSKQRTGVSFGVQSAANSLGQAGGPLRGSVLFVWPMNAPYFLSGALLIALTLIITGNLIFTRRHGFVLKTDAKREEKR
ncbi:MAG: MFS transporter [Thermoflexales bacterium]